MLEPFEGRVLDPACGSGGLFVQSCRVRRGARRSRPAALDPRPGEQPGDLADREDEPRDPRRSAPTSSLGDSLLDDKSPGLKADFVMANPPFNMKKWGAAQVAKDASLGVRAAARRERELRLDPALHPPPCPRRPGWLRDGERLADLEPRTAKGRSVRRSFATTWSTASSRCRRSSSSPPASPSACGSSTATRRPLERARPPRRDALHRRARTRPEDQPDADRAVR